METKKRRKISLSNKVIIGMIAGAIVGFIVGPKISAIGIVGDVFLRMLRMAIVPLIFFNVIVAIGGMGDLKKLGSYGLKLIVLFMGTTIASTTIGLITARVIRPDAGAILGNLPAAGAIPAAPTVSSVILGMFPTNIMQAMSEANMLQVIVFAIFAGIAILLLKESDRNRVTGMFEVVSRFIMAILRVVMEFLPYGVFALMAVTTGTYGLKVIGPLSMFIVTIYVGLILHWVITYFGLYYAFTKKNPLTFVKRAKPIWITSIATCSTAATMPVSIKTCEEELGLKKDIVGLTIPIGATMNMDANGLWFGVLAIFVAGLVGVHLSLSQQFVAVFLGVLMTLGSPGIPGGIVVASAIFLTALGLPIQVIGLLAGILRIMDMGLTTTNVMGTVFCAAILDAIESKRKRVTIPESTPNA